MYGEDPMSEKQLTLSQRFQFDSQGNVLLKGVLSHSEIDACKRALYRIHKDSEAEFQRVYRHPQGTHHALLGNLVAYDPVLLHYATQSESLQGGRGAGGKGGRTEDVSG